ncbi:MAG: hypothetical protein DMF47_01895 [Verrucomicrobia bacterium]|nr:MAG: hypothetical protein DMF47_01895 [Verrucomicrobiota bacterium]
MIDFLLPEIPLKIGNRKSAAPPRSRAQKNFGVRGHVRALTKGQTCSRTLQTSIGGGGSVFLTIENRQSKI